MFLEKVCEVDGGLHTEIQIKLIILKKDNYNDLLLIDNKVINTGWNKKELINEITTLEEDSLFQDERPLTIIISILIANIYIPNYHLQNLFKMSKTKILKYIRMLKQVRYL